MSSFDEIVADLEAKAGFPLQGHQLEALQDAQEQVAGGAYLRLCLYHRTGAGKSLTALACMAVAGVQDVLVVAPPITHAAWADWGVKLGMEITSISHAKFRMKGFRPSRKQAIIMDEFHLLGGQKGVGWKKLDRMAAGLQAPLVIASATPNYNDAERCYCIQHVLSPESARGGFLEFLATHCRTRTNPFGAIPLVDGFIHYANAEEYLKALPKVHYVEDVTIKRLVIDDIHVDVELPEEFEKYGLIRRDYRTVASDMEGRHATKYLQIIADDEHLRPEVRDVVLEQIAADTSPVMIFCYSARVAEAVHRTLTKQGFKALLLTGKTATTTKKAEVFQEFLTGKAGLIVGTATLATGADGLDKVCDRLLIVDDTDDISLRRQLVGRILPRGLDTDATGKTVTRLVYV